MDTLYKAPKTESEAKIRFPNDPFYYLRTSEIYPYGDNIADLLNNHNSSVLEIEINAKTITVLKDSNDNRLHILIDGISCKDNSFRPCLASLKLKQIELAKH